MEKNKNKNENKNKTKYRKCNGDISMDNAGE